METTMRRRDFVAALGSLTLESLTLGSFVAAWPFAANAAQSTNYARALQEAKRAYAKIAHPSEAARADYITRLIRLREKAAAGKTDAWQAIDAEIKQHPAPANADSKVLSALLAGKWESPRHDYLYRPDGTWTMLPADPGITNGTWRIQGNQLFDTTATDPPTSGQSTIILISKTDFVIADGDDVFYEVRLK